MLVSDQDIQVLYERCASSECSKSCYDEVGSLWYLQLYAVGQGQHLLNFVAFFTVSMILELPPVFSLPARE